jgi:hypothetical protein
VASQKKDKKKSKDGSKDGSEGENGHAEEGSLKVSSGGSEGSMDEDDDDVPTDENVAVEDAAAFGALRGSRCAGQCVVCVS